MLPRGKKIIQQNIDTRLKSYTSSQQRVNIVILNSKIQISIDYNNSILDCRRCQPVHILDLSSIEIDDLSYVRGTPCKVENVRQTFIHPPSFGRSPKRNLGTWVFRLDFAQTLEPYKLNETLAKYIYAR